jgi:very-short-patch-repair endonuclease
MKLKPLTPLARKLRRTSTDAEQRLWPHLRARRLDGVKFTRQFVIGPHIADFAAR